jgi:hypothetical protein
MGSMGIRNLFNGLIFSTALSILLPVLATDPPTNPDTDSDGLTDLEETAPGEFEVITNEVTWPEAKALAASRGGYLATITSSAEWDRLVPLLIASGVQNFWLGASDEQVEGEWRWVTGEPFSFNLWDFGEPNNCCGGEHFLAVTTNFWNDAGARANSGSRAAYVIEWGLNSDPTKVDTDGDGLYDFAEVKVHHTFPYLSDSDGDGLNDLDEVATHQFEVMPGEVTWLEAKAAALARGGYLATVTSAQEWDELQSVLMASGQLNFWLGATDERSEGAWRWVTGEPFTFSLWNSGEPNNCCGGEHFLAVTPAFWNDAGNRTSPDSRASYVVERGLNSDPTKADTDGDGLSDYAEVKTHHTFPYLADSDEDLFSDAAEVAAGSNPLNPDSIPPDSLNVFPATEIEFFTAAGTRYQLEATSNFLTWIPVGESIQGTGQIHRQLLSARHGVRLFYRLRKVE